MGEQNPNFNKLLEENILLRDSIEEHKRFFDIFSETCIYMNCISKIDALIAFLVNKLAESFRVNKVSFMLLDEAKKELFVKASQGLNPAAGEVRTKLGELFSGWVAKEGKPLLVKDVESEFPDLLRDRLTRYSTKSFIAVPVKVKDGIIGVLNLTDKKGQGIFTEDDLKMLGLISNNLALCIENIRLLEKNNSLLILDPLTNLFNHRYFHEQLLEEIYRAERYKRSLSIIMLDIDDFAYYNQNHGYAAGDSVLKQTAIIIKENTRQADVISRYGPEEFTVILPESKLKEALLVGEKIRKIINYAVFSESENRKSHLGISKLTLSAGVAEHKVGLRKEELINRAASALLEAKQKGKNCVCVFK